MVLDCEQLGVGAQQQVVEVLPGVVATARASDAGDDGLVGASAAIRSPSDLPDGAGPKQTW